MLQMTQLSGFGGGASYALQNSLALNGTSQFIQRTALASLNQQKGTWACWLRLNVASTRQIFFATDTAGSPPGSQFEKESTNYLIAAGYSSGYTVNTPNNIFADNAWHHLCFAFDTTLGTNAQRLHIYMDGVEVTYSAQSIGAVNIQRATDIHTWGYKPSTGGYVNGKIADIHYINGLQLLPSAFISGSGPGICAPIRYAGSFPAGSYHLGFANADLVDDSGNGLNFTGTGSPTFSTDVPRPYDAETKLLLHGDGADASTVFTDSSVFARAMTFSGNAKISTAQSKFGGASILFDGAGDIIFPNTTAGIDFTYGTGDFIIEFWMRPTANNATAGLYDERPDASSSLRPTIYTSSGILQYYTNGANRISGGQPAANTWSHVLVSRVSGQTRMFLNGTQVGSTYADSNSYTSGSSSRPFIGALGDGSSGFNGHLDEIRVRKGIGVSADFTPPTGPYT